MSSKFLDIVVYTNTKLEVAGVETTYENIWREIRHKFPQAVLIRGCLDDAEDRTGDDLDVLIDYSQLTPMSKFLVKHGYYEEVSMQSFRRTWRKRISGMTPLTIDIYTKELWGYGLSLTNRIGEIRPIHKRLMRAIYDKRSIDYFVKKYPAIAISDVLLGERAMKLLDYLAGGNHMRLLGAILVITGKSKIEPKYFLETVIGRTKCRINQIRRRRGLEIALIGIDGTGKTTLSKNLESNPCLPIKPMYMGSSNYITLPMRLISNRRLIPSWLKFLLFHWEQLVRRIIGRVYAYRGYIVVFDRHPAEQLRLNKSIRSKINNMIVKSYNWNVDNVFWLDGDSEALYERKGEHGVVILDQLREQLRARVDLVKIPHVRIDAVGNNEEQVLDLVFIKILKSYVENISIAAKSD